VKYLIFLILFVFVEFNALCQEDIQAGLFFSSHEVIQDKRTSLNLSPEEPFKFANGFTLEFDANFRDGDGYYGYIFRIIGDNNTNIDLVSNLEPNASSNFYLVLKDKVLFSYKWSEIPNGSFDKWLNIRVDIDIKNTKLIVSFNGNKQEVDAPDIFSLKYFNIEFGASLNLDFLNTDVSPMSLKDIKIFNSKGVLEHNWKLSKHGQNIVYDELGQSVAHVENPIWNIDTHVNWKKIKELEIGNILGITKDEDGDRIFIVGEHAIYVISPESAKIDTILFEGGMPYLTQDKQIVYNKFTNELWSYSFNSNEIIKFSFAQNIWSKTGIKDDEPVFWHHNKFISPVDSSLITLMGYGFYNYKSIINYYDLKRGVWKNIDTNEQVYPRYLSGAGIMNDSEALVFGGYGSKTGRQELSPENYYDLYLLNLNDFTFKKLWTLDSPVTPFVPLESIVPDQQSGCFYALVYNRGSYKTYLHLAKFGIYNNDVQFYNDSIPYDFLDTESWGTLFLNKKNSQLLAITSHVSEVSIYSMAFPPLSPEDVYQSVSVKNQWSFWITIGFGLLLTGLLFLWLLKFRKGKGLKETFVEHFEKLDISPVMPIERITSNASYFIGGFQLYNRKGENITTSFSPTLKQLFVFLFLYAIKNSKGVSSQKLDEALWFDKTGDSARNNRNVNISKLRTILSEVDGIEVVKENSFWSINMSPPFYSDYNELLKILNKSKSELLTEAEIHRLIALLIVGEFLPGLQNEWMDKFKAQFTNEMIDRITSMFKEKEVKGNQSLIYHLADCILLHEPLNDEALAVKCTILNSLGKTGRAKRTYDSFCKEYKKILGINYSISFKDIIR